MTGIDDHSRFIVCAKAVAAATARLVCLALTGALARPLPAVAPPSGPLV